MEVESLANNIDDLQPKSTLVTPTPINIGHFTYVVAQSFIVRERLQAAQHLGGLIPPLGRNSHTWIRLSSFQTRPGNERSRRKAQRKQIMHVDARRSTKTIKSRDHEPKRRTRQKTTEEGAALRSRPYSWFL